MRINSIIIIIFFLFFSNFSALMAQEHVLLLNSYNQRMSWVEDIVAAVDDVLDPDKNNTILHIANMDSKQFHTSEYFDSYKTHLKKKYKNRAFSLILSSDNNAFDFLRKNRDELFPGVPVVFCGVNNFKDNQIIESNKFTGVAEIFSARNTVEMALKLHPGTKHIFIINDYLETGRAWKRDIDAALNDMKRTINITFSKNLSIDELQATITDLNKNTIVLLGVYFADKNGKYFTYEKVGEMISGASQMPVYCLLEFNMGSGVVGGEVISGYYQGQTMAKIGKRILDGEDPDNIPVIKKGTNRVVFDYLQLKRFGLTESSLPKRSVIINKPFSAFDLYKKEIFTAASLILLLIITIIAMTLNIWRRIQAEKALKQSSEGLRKNEEQLKAIFNASPDPIVVYNNQGYPEYIYSSFTNVFGWQLNELRNKRIPFVPEDQKKNTEFKIKEIYQSGIPVRFETKRLSKYGVAIDVLLSAAIIKGNHEINDGLVVNLKDITEKKKLEIQLQQTQKMESIGTLAGGIAHDFNNILFPVLGHTEMLLQDIPEDNPAHSDLEKIYSGAKRARDLVKQILTFSRQESTEQKLMKMQPIIKEALKLIRSSLPTTIDIKQDIRPDCNAIKADPTQIHQIVMNLTTNAYHAMEESGGILTISLKEIQLNEHNKINPDMVPGNYVCLSVGDTGEGMDKELKVKVFDPFFTTKEIGKGTGMGLSVVHGIVESMKGSIQVESTQGKGTEFNIYFPMEKSLPKIQNCNLNNESIVHGTEHILLVDDENLIITMGKQMLERLGYHVTSCISSIDALEVFKANSDKFDLVITDMTMPNMPGDKLSVALTKMRPDIPILICTGFSNNMTEERAESMGIKGFLLKPIVMRDLSQKIREVLDKN
ncbi:MAG: response regulator [Desulfobacteraceae bacterium]|nr:response regulator [Desulfobacteraceae bacterium]